MFAVSVALRPICRGDHAMTTSRQSGRKNKNVTPVTSKSRPAVTVKSATGQPPVQEPVTTTGAYTWTHDYDYVKKDLRKLGIVSAVLFLAIIVAGFFF
jgi:hypothetical protein